MDIYDKIKARAVEIVKSSNGGCSKAKNVISLHQMMVAHADHATLALLECAFNDWVKDNPTPP